VKTLECASLDAWRLWLKDHHHLDREIWLVFYRQGKGGQRLSYDDALDEALCWGWIDSLIRRIDDTTFARKFTPRRAVSKWSTINKRRVSRLIDAGRMTRAGLAIVHAAKANGCWDKPDRLPVATVAQMPAEFRVALEQNQPAFDGFRNLARSHQKDYMLWIAMAKRHETKAKRIKEAIRLLRKGEQLGLR
jgi:uncharacterized protein YdeI (YjbR/CyaY-like superfamily)